MRRPLALVDGHAYAAAWLYARVTTAQHQDKDGHLVQHDPPLVETGLRLFVVRDDGTFFGPGGDHPLDALGLDVLLPEMPPPSRTWSAQGVRAYRAGLRPDPATVLTRIADVASRFVDFDHSLADQRTMAELVACYVLATWFLDAFNVIGYLWALGLAHLPTMHEYERAVNEKARLAGRTLEPWRAILAVALWLEDHDPQNLLRRTTRRPREDRYSVEITENGLWEHLEGLSAQYQTERSDLEAGDLTVLVIRALCVWTARAIIEAIRHSGEAPSSFVVTTDEVVAFAQALTKKDEGDPASITHWHIGRVLGRMRLAKAPRPGGQGRRRWKVTLRELERWTMAYDLPLPAILAPEGSADPPPPVPPS
jgi:hypothetical protein